MHKFVADTEAKGIKFRRIDYQFWKDNPGIDVSGAKLGKALKEGTAADDLIFRIGYKLARRIAAMRAVHPRGSAAAA